jgi:hypothetical protein
MSEQAATQGKNDRPKKLYEVLMEEYRRLGIFTQKEADDILDREMKHPFFESKDEKQRRELGEFMLAELRRAIHEKVKVDEKKIKPFAAICFSGGGIRSATFNLGILQGLARHNLLDKFHYLSTVSGGGYIGSWLSAWIYRKRVKAVKEKRVSFKEEEDFSTDFVKEVQAELAPKRQNKAGQTAAELHEVEPLEIKHLRSYSNYMSPRPGLFTTDTWALITVYLRNILLNWTVLVPLMAAMLLLPRLFYGIISKSREYLSFNRDLSGEELILFGASVLAGCVAIGCMIAMRPTLREYFWTAKSDLNDVKSAEPKVMSACVFLTLFLAFGFTVFWAWFQKDHFRQLPSIFYFIAYGAVLYVVGGIFAVIFALFSRKRLAMNNKEDKKRFYPVREFFAALTSGGIGGAMLYLIVDLFSKYPIFNDFLLYYACFGIPLFLVAFLLSATVFIGVASKITDDMDREWLSRFGALLLIFAVVWSVMSSIVLLGQLLFTDENYYLVSGWIASVGGLSGIITLVLGFSRKSGAKDDKEPKSKTAFLLWFAPQVAAPIFAAFLMILLAFGTFKLMYFAGNFLSPYIPWLNMSVILGNGAAAIKPPNFFISLFWIFVLAGIGALMGWFVNINKFSLHATYRERLIRSYLGASRAEERLKTANSFTGLDSRDNVEMKELLQRPFHVVNMTLNLANSKNLRWQNRKAESFTSTALHSGSSNMEDGIGSYRSSENYGYNQQSGTAISLGTAAAISGAAASPNMGYYTSSKAVSFLMALFNVRLGWWLGNPGESGKDTYNLSAPNWSPKVFFAEALGLTDDRHKYVYLSDGGHFDNLGLYEMILRRVNLIVVCDSGADLDFGFNDFGMAIHKIRVDMGIPIEFENQSDIPTSGRNCGIATIKYKEVDGSSAENGTLIYIKPTLDGDEPIDLINYKKSNPDFPHEGTADQMYSESQFESYRKLGAHMINSFCCGDEDNMPCEPCSELSNLLENARAYLSRHGEDKEIGNKKKEVEKKILAFLDSVKFPNEK